MIQSKPGLDPEISNWKGQNIIDFQEDLVIKVNGQLSEKWFYTHMKGESESLPRIDVLNILSKYAGYSGGWQEFKYKKAVELNLVGKPIKIWRLLKISLLLIPVLVLLLFIIKMFGNQDYFFSFIDSDTGESVTDENLRIELFMRSEDPVNIKIDNNGYIKVRTNKKKVAMIVKAPYYLTDTVERTLKRFRLNEEISLHTDYYALMINYFSRSDLDSWEKRREQLDRAISEDAIIYQFPENRAGNAMAIYNKHEFIDKITIPSSGLRQIEIIGCRYLDGKIIILRFRIKREM